MPWNTPEELGERVCLTIPIARYLVPSVLSVLVDMSKLAAWRPFGQATKGQCTQEAMEALVASRWRIPGEEGCFPPDPDPCPECPDSEEEECCSRVIYPGHPSIEFKPADPFTSPDDFPDLFTKHPWLIGENPHAPGTIETDVTTTADILMSGIFDGNINFDAVYNLIKDVFDTLIDLIPDDFDLSFDADDFNFFPRFRVNFTGKGVVYLHLIGVPLGGQALISVDGQLFPPPKLVDTHSSTFNDIFQALPDIGKLQTYFDQITAAWNAHNLYALFRANDSIHEFEFDEDGDHYIDVTFLPKFRLSLNPVEFFQSLGWGGGLRKVVFTCPTIEAVCPTEPQKPRLRRNGECMEWYNPTAHRWECLYKLDEYKRQVEQTALLGVGNCDCEEEDECGESCCDECEE